MTEERDRERQRLTSLGYEFVRAEHLAEDFERLNGKSPDVVLLEQAVYNGIQAKVICEVYTRKAGIRVARISPDHIREKFRLLRHHHA